jgi:hypothetical protein
MFISSEDDDTGCMIGAKESILSSHIMKITASPSSFPNP